MRTAARAMIFDSSFDRITILTLDPHGARAEATLADLAEKKLTERATLTPAYRGDEMLAPDWFHASAGAWGCLKSHIRVLEDALRDGVQSLLVLEDDCIWLPESARLAREFLGEVPADWGQIYFGGQLRAKFPREALPGKVACLRARSVHRTHAYAVARATLPSLLQHIQQASDYRRAAARKNGKKRHLDHQLEAAHQSGAWPVYVPSYWLAGQRANYSVVRQREEPERWWQVPPKEPQLYTPLVVADRALTAAEQRQLYFGCRLSLGDPTIDEDVARAEGKAALLRIMKMVAQEALKDRRLPALHPWDDKCAILEKCWPAGVLRLSAAPDLSPWAGTVPYPHPWLNPEASS